MMGLERSPMPAALLARTTQAYSTPLTNPPTVKGLVSPLALQVSPAAVHWATYVEMADCPVYSGVTNAMVALAFPGLAVAMDGAQGSVPNSLHPASDISVRPSSAPWNRMVRSTY